MEPVILYVEDNPVHFEVVKDVLSREPYTLLRAESGTEARRILHEQRVALVLLDVILPEGPDEGFHLCREIKTDLRTKHIPVILLTRRMLDSDLEEALQAETDDHIPKPFSYKKLSDIVKRYIEMSAEITNGGGDHGE